MSNRIYIVFGEDLFSKTQWVELVTFDGDRAEKEARELSRGNTDDNLLYYFEMHEVE